MSDFSVEFDRTTVAIRISYGALIRWTIIIGMMLFLTSDSPR